MSTGIEWTDETWNPTTGCDQVSPGCDHCYALTMAKRLKGMGSKDYQNDGDPKTSGPGFAATMHPHRLDVPLRWRRPRRVFVNSMSDLFHEAVSDDFIAQVFAVMWRADHHSFQVLTKRHGRMRSLLGSERFHDLLVGEASTYTNGANPCLRWPLPNVWLGVSVEDQKWADIRIPALLDTPAAVRFLSCEPLLGPIDLERAVSHYTLGQNLDECHKCLTEYEIHNDHNTMCPRFEWPIGWVIVGGESGPGARPMHPDWARSLRGQCTAAGVPFLFKQWGEWAPHRLDGGHVRNYAETAHRNHYESIRFQPDGTLYKAYEPDGYGAPGMASVLRVGKKTAGRKLDGRTWDQYPELVTA